MLEIDVDGAIQVAADLQRNGATARAKAYTLTRTYGQLLIGRIQANIASKGLVAGTDPFTYIDSWRLEMRSDVFGPSAEAYSEVPYGRRLEDGYVGTDRLGRTYNQAPRAHVGPAADALEPVFEAAIAGIAD